MNFPAVTILESHQLTQFDYRTILLSQKTLQAPIPAKSCPLPARISTTALKMYHHLRTWDPGMEVTAHHDRKMKTSRKPGMELDLGHHSRDSTSSQTLLKLSKTARDVDQGGILILRLYQPNRWILRRNDDAKKDAIKTIKTVTQDAMEKDDPMLRLHPKPRNRIKGLTSSIS